MRPNLSVNVSLPLRFSVSAISLGQGRERGGNRKEGRKKKARKPRARV